MAAGPAVFIGIFALVFLGIFIGTGSWQLSNGARLKGAAGVKRVDWVTKCESIFRRVGRMASVVCV